MPQRQLKPGIIRSLRFNRCSTDAQNLYFRLITLVDDWGRFNGHPLEVAAAAFPYGNGDGKPLSPERCLALLQELATNDLIVAYKERGTDYLALTRWSERIRSAKSIYPDPPKVSIYWQFLTFSDYRQPLLSNDSNRQQLTTVVGRRQRWAPSPSPSPSPSCTEKNREAAGVERRLRTRFVALRERIKAMKAAGDPEPEARKILRSMEVELEAIQKKQAAGDFTETPVKEGKP